MSKIAMKSRLKWAEKPYKIAPEQQDTPGSTLHGSMGCFPVSGCRIAAFITQLCLRSKTVASSLILQTY